MIMIDNDRVTVLLQLLCIKFILINTVSSKYPCPTCMSPNAISDKETQVMIYKIHMVYQRLYASILVYSVMLDFNAETMPFLQLFSPKDFSIILNSQR